MVYCLCGCAASLDQGAHIGTGIGGNGLVDLIGPVHLPDALDFYKTRCA